MTAATPHDAALEALGIDREKHQRVVGRIVKRNEAMAELFVPETFWLDLTESLTYDCLKCGDGDALLLDEACAYCGLVKGPNGEEEC